MKNLIIFIIGLVILSGVVFAVAYVGSVENIEIVVKDKERITTGSGESISSKYLVYTENEVFENTDTILFLKFDSSDVQNSLEKDKSYRVKVVGWRVPFLSWYRNIISLE